MVNNTNVLCMGGFIIGHEMGPEMAEIVGKEFRELVKFEEEIYEN